MSVPVLFRCSGMCITGVTEQKQIQVYTGFAHPVATSSHVTPAFSQMRKSTHMLHQCRETFVFDKFKAEFVAKVICANFFFLFVVIDHCKTC